MQTLFGKAIARFSFVRLALLSKFSVDTFYTLHRFWADIEKHYNLFTMCVVTCYRVKYSELLKLYIKIKKLKIILQVFSPLKYIVEEMFCNASTTNSWCTSLCAVHDFSKFSSVYWKYRRPLGLYKHYDFWSPIFSSSIFIFDEN